VELAVPYIKSREKTATGRLHAPAVAVLSFFHSSVSPVPPWTRLAVYPAATERHVWMFLCSER